MKVKLIDENEVINRESFYNYLTAWYNIDNMMYYVSQGQIFPQPLPWAFNKTVSLFFILFLIIYFLGR